LVNGTVAATSAVLGSGCLSIGLGEGHDLALY